MPHEADVLSHDELDLKFCDEISAQPGGEKIKRCIVCGTCFARRLIAEIARKFNPRKTIEVALLGLKSKVFSSDFIWTCSGLIWAMKVP